MATSEDQTLYFLQEIHHYCFPHHGLLPKRSDHNHHHHFPPPSPPLKLFCLYHVLMLVLLHDKILLGSYIWYLKSLHTVAPVLNITDFCSCTCEWGCGSNFCRLVKSDLGVISVAGIIGTVYTAVCFRISFYLKARLFVKLFGLCFSQICISATVISIRYVVLVTLPVKVICG